MTLPLVTINGTAAYLTHYNLPWWLQQQIQMVCVNLTLLSGGVFGMGSGAIWLDNVQCTGEEEGVWQCSHEDTGPTDCQCGVFELLLSTPTAGDQIQVGCGLLLQLCSSEKVTQYGMLMNLYGSTHRQGEGEER